jgi:lysophospholipase L1-like esterase
MQRGGSALLLVSALGLLAVPALADKAREDKARDDKKEKPVVLHIGDSFVGAGFAQSLKPRFEALGAKYVSIAQTSGYTTTLPRQVNLEDRMKTLKPVLVILTIGANEMAMPSPEDHAHAAKNLTRIISQAPSCIWALPPRWSDKETGFRQVMMREAPPCKIHDPEEIASKIPRMADKIHPTLKGGQLWADHFWSWAMAGRPEGAKPWDEPRPGASASAGK